MASLESITALYERRLAAIARGSCSTLASRVVSRTPVDTGALRASWTPGIGRGVRARNVNGPSAGRSERVDIASVVNALRPGEVFTMINVKLYARRIEYGSHSAQAPTGMMEISLIEFPAIVRAETRRARRGN